MKTKRIQNDPVKFIEQLEKAGLEPRKYSGRGMFGSYCVSLRGRSVWEISQKIAHLNLPNPHTDSLGLGVVVYWPGFEWPTEDYDVEDGGSFSPAGYM